MKKLFLVLMLSISSLHSMVVEMPALASKSEIELEEALALGDYAERETRLLSLIESTDDEGVQDRARFALAEDYEFGKLGNQDRKAFETVEKYYLLACLLNVGNVIEKKRQQRICFRLGKHYYKGELGGGTLEDDQQAVRYLEAAETHGVLNLISRLYSSGRLQPRTSEGEIAKPSMEDIKYAEQCLSSMSAWCENELKRWQVKDATKGRQ